MSVAADDEALQRKSLTGRFPVLEDTENQGVLVCDGLPIARYLARENAQFTSGASIVQKAQIDAWTDYI